MLNKPHYQDSKLEYSSELRAFILYALGQDESKSRIQYEYPDMREILPALAHDISELLFPHMPLKSGGMTLPFFEEVKKIILEAIEPMGGTPIAAGLWSGSLLNSILNNMED